MKIKRIYKIAICFLLMAAVLYLFPFTAGASTNNFYVRAVIPDNQVDKDLTYFDLRLEAGEKQTVQISINNPGEEDLIVKIALNPAITQRNGLIVYDPAEETNALPDTPIDTIATIKTAEVNVPAESSKLVDIDIKMPSGRMDGVILGGLVVTAEKASSGSEQEQESLNAVTLENEFNYIIGLKLTQNSSTVAPDFDLIGIEPGIVNYHTAVTATLKNLKPIIVKNMQVKAQIFKKGSNDQLYDLEIDSAEMAPDTSGKFVIDCKSDALEPGDYRLKMSANYEGETWEWDEEFQITKTQADNANDEAVDIVKNHMFWYIFGCILLIILFIIIAFWLGRRGRNSK